MRHVIRLATVLAAAWLAFPGAAGSAEPPPRDETNWNLLGLFSGARPGVPAPESTSDPEALFLRGETLYADRADDELAVRCFESYLRAAGGRQDAREGKAKLYLGLLHARNAPATGRDGRMARQALHWLLQTEGALRDAAAPEIARMRARLGGNELFVGRFYAVREKWAAVEHRLGGFADGYPDTLADPEVRGYLEDIKRSAEKSPGDDAASRAASRAAILLATPPSALPPGAGAPAAAGEGPRLGLPAAPSVAGGGPGRTFDGSRPGSPGIETDLELRDGQVRDLRVRAGAWELQAGQLGLGGPNALLEPSPFVNLRHRSRSEPAAPIDHRTQWQVGYIDMHARFFDPAGAPRLARFSQALRRLGVEASALDAGWGGVRDAVGQKGILVASVLSQAGRAVPIYSPLGSSVDFVWAATGLAELAYAMPNAAADASAGLRYRHDGAGLDLGLFGGVTRNLSPLDNRLLRAVATREGLRPGLHFEDSPHAAVTGSAPLPGSDAGRVEVGAGRRWNKDTVEDRLQAGVKAEAAGRPVSLRAGVRSERGAAIEYEDSAVTGEAAVGLEGGLSAFASCEKGRARFGSARTDNSGCLAGLSFAPAGSGAALTADTLFGGRSRLGALPVERAAELSSSLSSLLSKGVEVADALQRGILAPGSAMNDPATVTAALDQVSRFVGRLSPRERGVLADAVARAPLTRAQKDLAAKVISGNAGQASSPGAQEPPTLPEAAAGLASTLLPAGWASERYAARRGDILAVIGLLNEPELWEEAGRGLVRGEVVRHLGALTIPAGPLALKVSPPSALALAGVTRGRGSPLAPLTAADESALERDILGGAASALGLAPGATPRQMTERIADEVARRVEREAAALGPRPGAAAATLILQTVPEGVAAGLRERFGADLGLASASPEDVRAFIGRLSGEARRIVLERFGPEIERTIPAAAAFAAQLLRHEVDAAVLQLLEASKELDRLKAHGGLKAGDQAVRMMAFSVAQLDRRREEALRGRVDRMLDRAERDARVGREALGRAEAADARRRLEALQASADWNAGLSVSAAEGSLDKLAAAYGPDALLGTLSEMSRRLPKDKTMRLELSFDPFAVGVMALPQGREGLRLVLGPPASSRQAENLLEVAVGAVAEAAAREKKRSPP